jgi:hypothetical protein
MLDIRFPFGFRVPDYQEPLASLVAQVGCHREVSIPLEKAADAACFFYAINRRVCAVEPKAAIRGHESDLPNRGTGTSSQIFKMPPICAGPQKACAESEHGHEWSKKQNNRRRRHTQPADAPSRHQN